MSRSGSAAETALERAIQGERLTDEEARALFEVSDLTALGMAADVVRRRLTDPRIVTYVVDRNINYTNVCMSGCAFCAFYRRQGHPEGYVITTPELDRKTDEALALGATQVLLQGGLHPNLPIDWYEQLLRHVRDRFPTIHIHGFSPPEIVHIARTSGLSVRQTLTRLKAVGLRSVPGGGAEILSDEVRREVSPHKCTTAEWLAVMEEAHGLGLPTTATMMLGHVETAAQRVEHLSRIRDLQDRTGGFTAFIPWTYQPGNTRLGGTATGSYEYLRTLAICRLYLDNVRNVQASWVTQGERVGSIALKFGANDLGSTMIEENVVAATGVRHRITIEEMRHMIVAAGYEPRQRDTLYNLIESAHVAGRR